jgi:type II protein arginine methyltransferase
MDRQKLVEAAELYRAGRLDQAAEICRALLAAHAGDQETLHLLGVILFRQGRNADAVALLAKAAGAPGATAEMHNNYGAVLDLMGEKAQAEAAFARALAIDPHFAQAINNLGVLHRSAKRTDAAISAFRRAAHLQPGLASAQANLRSAYRDVIPPWHFAMMDDQRRNDAYERAIAKAVAGKHVLDIGTGSGLLAMMAARGGAASVTSCEAVAIIAERARDIVALNGLSDRVRVVGKRSQDLVPGLDVPHRADVLVTETFSSGLIDEGVLPTVEDACARLLAPGATIIPAAASAHAYLAGGAVLRGMLFVETVNGFDLAPFNDFAPPSIGVGLDGVAHEILSEDFELMRFDLAARQFPMTSRRIAIRATASGTAAGLAQWIRLELDAETRYENRPSPEAGFNGHWTHVVYRFPRLVRVDPGDVVEIEIRNDRSQLAVDLVS